MATGMWATSPAAAGVGWRRPGDWLDGRPGSTATRSATFTLPEAGRVMAAGGHVHGGARDLTVRQPACGDRALWTNTPAWGLASHPFYNVRPILHEPGPIAMSALQTPTGIPLAKGSQIRLDATYDATRPHTRVMGIDIAYVAPDASVTDPCAPLPPDITSWQTTTPHRTASPRFVVPISPPQGRTRTLRGTRATIGVRDNRFTVPKAVVAAGTTLTWRFKGLQLHNVTVADGPRGFSSANLDGGRTYRAKLTVPGTYKLYCGLHPMAMTETVKVRPRRSR
jgi:plastocyanin